MTAFITVYLCLHIISVLFLYIFSFNICSHILYARALSLYSYTFCNALSWRIRRRYCNVYMQDRNIITYIR